MSIDFVHAPHPRIAARQVKPESKPPSLNDRIALALTTGVGTMWCAYAFAILALVVLPQAIEGGLLTLIQWVSQTFIQLVMLSVIMVGQNLLSKASDARAEATYKDADATFHEAKQIQTHLKAQDDAINLMLDKLLALEAVISKSAGEPAA